MKEDYITYEGQELPDLEVKGTRRPAVLMHDEINDRYYRGSTGQTLYPVDKYGSDNPADWSWTDDSGLKYSPNRDYNVEDLIGEQPTIGNQDNTGVQNTDYSYLDEDILDMGKDINFQNQVRDIIASRNMKPDVAETIKDQLQINAIANLIRDHRLHFSNGGPIVDRAQDAYNKINMFKFGV